jgi:hypothetical protein
MESTRPSRKGRHHAPTHRRLAPGQRQLSGFALRRCASCAPQTTGGLWVCLRPGVRSYGARHLLRLRRLHDQHQHTLRLRGAVVHQRLPRPKAVHAPGGLPRPLCPHSSLSPLSPHTTSRWPSRGGLRLLSFRGVRACLRRRTMSPGRAGSAARSSSSSTARAIGLAGWTTTLLRARPYASARRRLQPMRGCALCGDSSLIWPRWIVPCSDSMNGSALYLILESWGSPCTCRAIRRVWSMSSSGVRVVERWYGDYPTENYVIPTGPTLVVSTSASAGYARVDAGREEEDEMFAVLRSGRGACRGHDRCVPRDADGPKLRGCAMWADNHNFLDTRAPTHIHSGPSPHLAPLFSLHLPSYCSEGRGCSGPR